MKFLIICFFNFTLVIHDGLGARLSQGEPSPTDRNLALCKFHHVSPMISFDLVDELGGDVPIDCVAFQSKDAPLNR